MHFFFCCQIQSRNSRVLIQANKKCIVPGAITFTDSRKCSYKEYVGKFFSTQRGKKEPIQITSIYLKLHRKVKKANELLPYDK